MVFGASEFQKPIHTLEKSLWKNKDAPVKEEKANIGIFLHQNIKRGFPLFTADWIGFPCFHLAALFSLPPGWQIGLCL